MSPGTGIESPIWLTLGMVPGSALPTSQLAVFPPKFPGGGRQLAPAKDASQHPACMKSAYFGGQNFTA